ncbi:MAG: hypothetical protein IPM08_14305 [Actinomycetales bacterium]|nr:hypothetical protein [Actinomycetales bacterium]
MSFTEGADVEALVLSVARLAELAKQLVEVDTAVAASIVRLKAAWGGHDLDRFVAKHQSQVQPTLRLISQHTRTMGEELGRQVEEQRVGSSADGAAGPGPDGGNAAGGGTPVPGGGDTGGPDVTTGAGVEHSALDDLTKRPESEGPDASVTIVKGEASWENSKYHRSGDHYDVKAIGADASVSGSVSINDGAVNASVAAGASAYLGSASVHGELGPASGSASATAGAEVNADGKLSMGPGGVAGSAHAEAFVGAKAEVEAGVDLGVGEVKGGLQGYAGAGAHFDANAEFKDGKIKASVDMGAAVGLGFGYKVEVSIDTVEIVKGAGDVVKAIGDHLPMWMRF